MSLTAAVWVVLTGLLLLAAMKRPAWAVALYMATYFGAPHVWWWGDEVPDIRYALVSGVVLLAVVLMHASSRRAEAGRRFGLVHVAAIGMAVNATFVHLALAQDPVSSFNEYVELLKFLLLFFLIWAAIHDRRDFHLVLIAIAIGAAYLGYEVTINERGYFSGGRLEGVGPPGADSSNSLASLMLVTLPFIGCLFVEAGRRGKLLAIAAGPLALNVLLLCNSRGGFLGLMGAGLVFMAIARGATRKRAIQAMCLGGVALFLLLGDGRIFERFTTTFVGSADRDRSAASRLEFWQAGMLMLADHPLGAGGGAFKNAGGGKYLAQVSGNDDERSLHNGYLTVATGWGFQGLILHCLFMGVAIRAAYRASTRCRLALRTEEALVGLCAIAATAGLLIHSMFGTFLGSEWGYWLPALLIRYQELYGSDLAPEVAADPEPAAPGSLSEAHA